jgi:hypothetical protein
MEVSDIRQLRELEAENARLDGFDNADYQKYRKRTSKD